jgi:hypothetical protein
VPTEDDVFVFINPVFHKLRIKPESGVLTLVRLSTTLWPIRRCEREC